MRTGPVALPFLGDPEAIAAAAVAVSDLTHADPQCAEACVLWTIAVGSGVETGVLPDIRDGLDYLSGDARKRWLARIEEAEERPPGVFTPNGYVVAAFQAAWSSIAHTEPGRDHFRDGVTQAVRIGNDTDTVAAIAGTLLGATYGVSEIPDEWLDVLHGWPGYGTADVAAKAIAMARHSR